MERAAIRHRLASKEACDKDRATIRASDARPRAPRAPRAQGVRAVPTFALLPDRGDPAGGLRVVPGAQPTDLWLRLTDQARTPRAPDSSP